MVAVFDGTVPVQTRPYGYGNNYLKIINRSNERCEAGLRQLVSSGRLPGITPVPLAQFLNREGAKHAKIREGFF
jgi:hypothetical protein